MMIKGATGVAIAGSIGNLLQGWDNGAIAGALLYLKPEFNLDSAPALEGLVVASTLIGAVASVTVAGPAADWAGRKSMLCVSGVLFFLSALIMSWAPTVYILILGRILVGSAIGLAATIVPILISESSPAEIRGQLSTFPQFFGSAGLFLAYVMASFLSLQTNPNWRFMLGILSVPSLIYVLLCFFMMPESPRWLASKGRILEAKTVLQNLRNREDVSAELALLVEGLGVGAEGHLEEWLLKPAEKVIEEPEGQIKLFSPDESVAWVATPVVDESGTHQHHGLLRTASTDSHALLHIDSMVTLLGNIQTTLDQQHITHETYDDAEKPADWDEEAQGTQRYSANGYSSDTDLGMVRDVNENLRTPLLSERNDGGGPYKNLITLSRSSSQHKLSLSRSNSRDLIGGVPEPFGSVGIGGGWQLAWQWKEKAGSGEGEDVGLKRVFLKSEGGDLSHFHSAMSLPGVEALAGEQDAFMAAVLVAEPAVGKDLLNEHAVGPAMVHPAETAKQSKPWSFLLEGGVRRALTVGVGLQILQQFCGINAVLYYSPQILMQSGAGDLLASVGIDSESASIMASGLTCFLMLPCILMAMWLMDRSGRQLLLATMPILAMSLVAVVLTQMFLSTGLIPAVISFTCVTIFICSFVTGFGPIPNILCSEIFPTRVRGICIGICAAAMWGSNVIVTYSFPVLVQRLGLQGVFSIFAAVSVISWIFVFLRVPETKGLPLELISEFFALSTKKDEKGHAY